LTGRIAALVLPADLLRSLLVARLILVALIADNVLIS